MAVDHAAMKPIAEGLFVMGDRPRLVGSECGACRAVDFPARGECSRCHGGDVEKCLLPHRGRLWSWTVQTFRPVSPPYAGPKNFTPFGVGYVELDTVCVETILELPKTTPLEIGDPVEMFLLPIDLDGEEPVLTFAFRATGDDA